MARAQASVFIILGVIIVIAVGLMLYLSPADGQNEGEKANSQAIQSVIPSVTTYVEQCLQQTVEEGILFLGKHGGYYELPDPRDDVFSLPYHFYDSKKLLLSQDELQRQLSMYVKQELFFCIKNFVPFREQGYTVHYNEMDVRTELTPSQAKVSLYYQITMSMKGASATVQEFSAAVPTRLLAIHTMVDTILTQQEQQPDSICISCLVTEGIANHARVEMYRIDDTAIWFSVIDEEGFIRGEQFSFNYLNRYPEGSADEEQ
ncbi:hypothetical protein HYS47_05675 [Candidatus Woesearchaeota archaeon]|nr:hypothetical protein [Candidatus Woesearchaeota archaeon]